MSEMQAKKPLSSSSSPSIVEIAPDDAEEHVSSSTTTTTSVTTMRNKASLTTIVTTRNTTRTESISSSPITIKEANSPDYRGGSSSGSSPSHRNNNNHNASPLQLSPHLKSLPPIVEEFLRENPLPPPPVTIVTTEDDDGDNEHDVRVINNARNGVVTGTNHSTIAPNEEKRADIDNLTVLVPNINRPRSRSAIHLTRSLSDASTTSTPCSPYMHVQSGDENLPETIAGTTPLHHHNKEHDENITFTVEELEKQKNELNRERREFERMKREFMDYMRREKQVISDEKRELRILLERFEKEKQGIKPLSRVPNLSPRQLTHATDDTTTTSGMLSARTESTEDDLMTLDESHMEFIDNSEMEQNSYDEALKRLMKRKTATADFTEYKEIMCEDEHTSTKRASVSTKVQIAKEVSLLLSDRQNWSTENEEVRQFRSSMAAVHAANNQVRLSLAATKSVLPPLYITNDPAVSQFEKTKDIMCKIYIPDINVYKTIMCPAGTYASQLLDILMSKVSNDGHLHLTKEDHLFKASGFSSDYIYGDTAIIEFEHVWNCLKSGNRVTLTVASWDSIWNELDLQDISLKSIDYQFDQVVQSDDNTRTSNNQIISWNVAEPFRFKMINLENMSCHAGNTEIYISAQLLMGNLPLSQERFSQASELESTVRFGQYINFNDVLVSEIPREATLHILCYSRSKSSSGTVVSVGPKDVLISSINVPLYTFNAELKSGVARYRMWPGMRKYIYSENKDSSSDAPFIQIEFDTRGQTIVYCDDYKKIPPQLSERWIMFEQKRINQYPKLSHSDLLVEFNRIISTDPLYQLNDEERYRLWSVRSAQLLTSDPRVLFKFMQSVPWKHPQAIAIAEQLLDKWENMEPIDAIGLLNYNYTNSRLRRYAVKILNKLSDNELKGLLLQLVQTLKFELYHDSALARFLVERSLKSTHMIGHVLFWHMKSEMHDPSVSERYGLILEEYLTNCGSHRRELLKQNGIVEQLFSIAMLIKETKKADQVSVLRRELAKMAIPPKFKLPLSTRVDLSGILVDKCKVMNSKKLPLWLVFENADKTGSPVYVIFKAGDDLRQDLLTLQMLNSMDVLWKSNNLNLRLNPYGCVCLGDMIGMIEVVLNSDTVANITHERGGASAAFSVDPLTVWLRKNCNSDQEFENCVKNFVKSCAGYCVATYVLGIGDRHNDNIMLTKKGDLFHIDFGHFLGNFKSFKGIYKRETTPFVFTPMYAHVMGGTDADDYKEFVRMGCDAFLVLRKFGHMLMNMFLLMLPAGIPELSCIEDIEWLRKVLKLESSEEEAIKHFRKQIKKSLKNTRARINDAVHIYAKK